MNSVRGWKYCILNRLVYPTPNIMDVTNNENLVKTPYCSLKKIYQKHISLFSFSPISEHVCENLHFFTLFRLKNHSAYLPLLKCYCRLFFFLKAFQRLFLNQVCLQWMSESLVYERVYRKVARGNSCSILCASF